MAVCADAAAEGRGALGEAVGHGGIVFQLCFFGDAV